MYTLSQKKLNRFMQNRILPLHFLFGGHLYGALQLLCYITLIQLATLLALTRCRESLTEACQITLQMPSPHCNHFNCKYLIAPSPKAFQGK